jgi:hypothetical protein
MNFLKKVNGLRKLNLAMMKTITIAWLLVMFAIAMTGRVYAATVVSIEPSTVTVPEVGQTFTVQINVTDVVDLYGYEIMLFFKNDILNATGAVRPSGHFLEPQIDPANQYVAKWEIKNNFNTTHGRLWLAYTLLAPETGRTGSGTLIEITFNGTNVGTTQLILADDSGVPGKVLLGNSQAQAIPNTTIDGTVTVVPEFPVVTFVLLFLMTSVAIATVKFKKTKNMRAPQ